MILPTRFWIVAGKGFDKEHSITAYDTALYECGLADQNMLQVTSVPPPDMIDVVIENGYTWVPGPDGMSAGDIKKKVQYTPTLKEIDGKIHMRLSTSSIICVVQARMHGEEGQMVCAGMGLQWYWTDETKTAQSVFAVEDHGVHNKSTCERNCYEMMENMLKLRGREPVFENGKNKQKIVTSIIEVPDNQVGCVLVMVVMDPFTMLPMSAITP
ncbi:MAG: pyruvoyl-dependent arginine decarboxylase [Promethearchaeota archaeon]